MMAHALRVLSAEGPPNLEIVEIGDLALYNEDLEADVPASWRRFRDRMSRAEAVLFVTPEYNRSLPGLEEGSVQSRTAAFVEVSVVLPSADGRGGGRSRGGSGTSELHCRSGTGHV
jgi:hypothetical protein